LKSFQKVGGEPTPPPDDPGNPTVDFHENGGPEHRTTQKILDGFQVQPDVLRKVVTALNRKPTHKGRKLTEVIEADIPNG
jgi:hypothetical protein